MSRSSLLLLFLVTIIVKQRGDNDQVSYHAHMFISLLLISFLNDWSHLHCHSDLAVLVSIACNIFIWFWLSSHSHVVRYFNVNSHISYCEETAMQCISWVHRNVLSTFINTQHADMDSLLATYIYESIFNPQIVIQYMIISYLWIPQTRFFSFP